MNIKKRILIFMATVLTISTVSLNPLNIEAENVEQNKDLLTIIENTETYLIGDEEVNNAELSQTKIETIKKNGEKNIPVFDTNNNFVYNNVPLGLDGTGQDTPAQRSGNLSTTYSNLYSVALAWATPAEANYLYQDEEVLQKLILALEWLQENYLSEIENGYYGNWYHWEIGIPTNLSKIILLLRDELDDDFILKSIDTLDSYIRGHEELGSDKIGDVNLDNRFHTGANLADITFNRIIQGAVKNDYNRVDKAVTDALTVFKTVDPSNLQHGVTDGFYEDGSFIQHSSVAYTGSYGVTLLSRIAQLVMSVNNTEWQDDTLMDTVEEWVYEGFAPIIYEGYMMEIVKGRAISRTTTGYSNTSTVIEALVQLSLSMDADERERLQSYVKYLVDNPLLRVNTAAFNSINNIISYDEIINDNAIVSVNPLEEKAHYAFNLMDKNVHLNEKYSFALSKSSDRISKYEYMSGENLKSWFQGDGAYYLYQSGVNQTDAYGIDFLATISPYELPGTTTVKEIRQTIPELFNEDFYHNPEAGFESGSVKQNEYIYFPLGTNDYSGSAKLGHYALAAMQLGDEKSWEDQDSLPSDFVDKAVYKNAEANKSWFMFDDKILVLGSNIHDVYGRDMQTTIENKMFDAETNPAVHSNIDSNGKPTDGDISWVTIESDDTARNSGYIFLDDNSIEITEELRTGRYSDVRNSTTGSNDREVSKEYVKLSYNHDGSNHSSYAYIILPNADANTITDSVDNLSLEILANEESVHAVRNNHLDIEGYSFFEENTSVNDIQAIDRMILMRNGNLFSVQDPTHRQETVSFKLNGKYIVKEGMNITAEYAAGFTTVTVRTHEANGVSQTFTLEKVDVYSPDFVDKIILDLNRGNRKLKNPKTLIENMNEMPGGFKINYTNLDDLDLSGKTTEQQIVELQIDYADGITESYKVPLEVIPRR